MWRSSRQFDTTRSEDSTIDQTRGRGDGRRLGAPAALAQGAGLRPGLPRPRADAPEARPGLQGGRRRHRQPADAERAALFARHYGDEHALTAAAYNNLGAARRRCGEHDDACAAFAKALKVAHEARSGRALHPAEPREAFDQALVPLRNLALHTLQRGDIRQALPPSTPSLLTTLHDPNLRPGVPKHAPSSTESFLAVGTRVEINQCVTRKY